MKSFSSVRQGAAAKLAGDLFELWIEGQHRIAKRLGILAHVEHNEPHSKIVGGKIIYTRAGVADYTATLWNGISLVLEAKSTASARLARAAIHPRQAAHLDAVARTPALALLLIELRNDEAAERTRYAVPWGKVPWKTLRTAESVMEADLSAWACKGACYLSSFVQAKK